MQRGDIYLAAFPFGDQPGMKLRPVLILTGLVGVGTEAIVGYISSVVPSALLASDILLDPTQPEHRQTGLRAVSVLRLHKIATIHTTSLRRYLGKVSAATQQRADNALRKTLNL
jgi:mRNA interferase MazF